jgi:hypothetical protein
MQAEVLKAAEAEKGGGWITYLIRDPRTPDKRGNSAGTPIYIGQTKEFSKRVLNRFMKSEKLAKAKDSIERRITDLLHADVVARYEVLERVESRLGSLVSETNWVKRCRNAGYDLCNNLQEQRFGGDLIDRYAIPTDRLDQFTLEEAIQDHIDVTITCTECHLVVSVDLARLHGLASPPSSIGDVKRELNCQKCDVCDKGKWCAKINVR